jgi:hypothetical protein
LGGQLTNTFMAGSMVANLGARTWMVYL